MNAIVLLGPPGAGKGTVAEVLVDKNYVHVSTGNLLREQVRLETPLGLEAKKLMDAGQFVPDDVVVGMIRELLRNADKNTSFMFDGFPRTLVQAQKLDELIESLSGTLSDVLLLECPDEVIVERMAGRRTCKTCGAVYHVKNNPSAKGELCEVDDGELIQRPDDTEETVRKRLEVYAEQTAPLIDYYDEKSLVKPVSANQGIDNLRNAALELLG